METESGELLVFKAISTFVIELGRLYEKEHIPLGLYKRLILKTKVAHIKPIKKHISAFRRWFEENKEALEDKDFLKLTSPSVIKYSDNVYIDMKKISDIVSNDDDVKNTIWKHLKTIHMLINGNQGSLVATNENYDKEKDFISDVIKKVETHVDPNSDPSQALSNMMNSGVFNDLLSGMNKGLSEGNLDISKLINITTGMLSSLQKNLP